MGFAAAKGAAKWLARSRRDRALLDLPQHTIEGISDRTGVRIRGHLEAEQLLRAPMTGRECIAWQVRVERPGALPNQPWKELCVESEAAPNLTLVGTTGRAVLDRVTDWRLSYDAEGGEFHWHSLTATDAAGIRAILTKHEVPTDQAGWDDDVRVQEAIVEPGEAVVVAAQTRWELNPRGHAAYRDVQRKLWLEQHRGRLIVSNDRRVLRRTPVI